MHKIAIWLFIILLQTSCSTSETIRPTTQASDVEREEAKAVKLAQAAVDKCFNDIYAHPALKPIANKIALGKAEASFEQLANSEKATDLEKPLLADFAKRMQICFDLDMKAQTSDFDPVQKTSVEDNYIRRINSLIDLYNQKISYGEYLTQRKESIIKTERELAARQMENAESIARENEYNEKLQKMEELQRKQNYLNALGAAASGMSNGIRNSMPPRAVVCSPYGLGGSIRCQ
jgi:hypothetical protein